MDSDCTGGLVVCPMRCLLDQFKAADRHRSLLVPKLKFSFTPSLKAVCELGFCFSSCPKDKSLSLVFKGLLYLYFWFGSDINSLPALATSSVFVEICTHRKAKYTWTEMFICWWNFFQKMVCVLLAFSLLSVALAGDIPIQDCGEYFHFINIKKVT